MSGNQSFAGEPLRATRAIGAPAGFPSACARYAWLCKNGSGRAIDEAAALKLLKKVNGSVNARIKPASDHALTGRADFWSLPISDRGDCEDYALLKTKMLLEAGLGANRLALAVVLDRGGKNHVVLVARLASADYVLDNLSGTVKPWNRTGYTFLASQNFNNRSSWQVTLAGPLAARFSGT